MLKKIWSDSVWSKVISAVILAVGGFIIIVIYSAITKLSLEQSIEYLWQYKIELGPTIIGIILILLVLAIIKKIAEISPSKRDKMASKFHQKYKKFDEHILPITYRFNAYIKSLTNFPFISELLVYCTDHNGIESLMTSYNGCPDRNSTNHRKTFSESLLKSQIETDLLKQWENTTK
jgi:hypothetical protein